MGPRKRRLPMDDNELGTYNYHDSKLYHQLKNLFVFRARELERTSGVKFLCDARANEAADVDAREAGLLGKTRNMTLASSAQGLFSFTAASGPPPRLRSLMAGCPASRAARKAKGGKRKRGDEGRSMRAKRPHAQPAEPEAET